MSQVKFINLLDTHGQTSEIQIKVSNDTLEIYVLRGNVYFGLFYHSINATLEGAASMEL